MVYIVQPATVILLHSNMVSQHFVAKTTKEHNAGDSQLSHFTPMHKKDFLVPIVALFLLNEAGNRTYHCVYVFLQW